MRREKSTNAKIFLSVVIAAVCLIFGQTAYSAECIPKSEMLDIIEKIPKTLPQAKNPDSFIVSGTDKDGLTVTVQQLMITFFDHRGSDQSVWGTVTNTGKNRGINEDLQNIGCVAAGVNSYSSGKVEQGGDALEIAQTKFNEYIEMIRKLMK